MKKRQKKPINPLDLISENDFLKAVLDLADLRGWLCYHSRPGLTQSGRWRTPAQGNGAVGFPDLVLVRKGQIVFAELKTNKGKVSDAQTHWLHTLAAQSNISVFVWRPCDMEWIERRLK